MSERKIRATVIGPATSGLLKIELGSGNAKHVTDVPVETIPSHLRMPNSTFFAVMIGSELVRADDFDQQWFDFQERIRAVLNSEGDSIGAARQHSIATSRLEPFSFLLFISYDMNAA